MANSDGGIFGVNLGFAAAEQKITRKKSDIVSRLNENLSAYWLKIFVFVLVSVAYAVTFVLFPRIIGEIIDIFVSSIINSVLGFENAELSALILTKTLIAVALFLFNAFFSYLQGVLVSGIVTSFSLDMKTKVLEKYDSLPMSYIDKADHSKIVGVITDDINVLCQGLNLLLQRTVTAIILFICIIVTQFTVDVSLAVVSLAVSFAGVLITVLLNKTESRVTKGKVEKENTMLDNAEEFFSGLHIVQRSGKINNTVEKLWDEVEEYGKKKNRIGIISALRTGVTELSSVVCCVAVSALGAFKIIAGDFSIGILQTQIVYVRKMFQSFSELPMSFTVGRSILVSAEKIYNFLDLDEETKNENDFNVNENQVSEITVKNVVFSYAKDKTTVLKDVSFSIEGKGITAISGETGVGKTTIAKLLLGFYDVQSGEILYNGKNINTLSLKDYRKKFNVIVQGATLFNDTIANNIGYACSGITFNEIKKAAVDCGADEFISKLPNGYDTVFDSENPILSSGEIQLILLARSFLRKNEFVIFDEATSNLDVATEKIIAEKLVELSKNCGIIVITHSRFAKNYADKSIHLTMGKVD